MTWGDGIGVGMGSFRESRDLDSFDAACSGIAFCLHGALQGAAQAVGGVGSGGFSRDETDAEMAVLGFRVNDTELFAVGTIDLQRPLPSGGHMAGRAAGGIRKQQGSRQQVGRRLGVFN